jgi:hypothetical protein
MEEDWNILKSHILIVIIQWILSLFLFQTYTLYSKVKTMIMETKKINLHTSKFSFVRFHSFITRFTKYLTKKKTCWNCKMCFVFSFTRSTFWSRSGGARGGSTTLSTALRGSSSFRLTACRTSFTLPTGSRQTSSPSYFDSWWVLVWQLLKFFGFVGLMELLFRVHMWPYSGEWTNVLESTWHGLVIHWRPEVIFSKNEIF